MTCFNKFYKIVEKSHSLMAAYGRFQAVVRLGSYPPADEVLRARYASLYGFDAVPSPLMIKISDFR